MKRSGTMGGRAGGVCGAFLRLCKVFLRIKAMKLDSGKTVLTSFV